MFLGVITGYLLIKQFKMDRRNPDDDDAISKTMHSDLVSVMSSNPQFRRNSRDDQVDDLRGLHMLSSESSTAPLCRHCQSVISYHGPESPTMETNKKQ